MAGRLLTSWAAGLQNQLAKLLGLQGENPEEVSRLIQPVAEARAIRYWEEFHEGIRRWGVLVSQGLVAGESSYVAVRPPVTAGRIVTIDRVQGNTTFVVGIATDSVITATLAATTAARYADARVAYNNAGAEVDVVSGTDAAQIEDDFALLPANGVFAEFPIILTRRQLGDNPVGLVLRAATVATALTASIMGRIIDPPNAS